MCPGNPLGDHGQRAIALPVIFEPVLAYEDGMGVSAPLPHQTRAGLQHAAGVERTSAFLELSGTRSVKATSSGTITTYAAKKMPTSQPASVFDKSQRAM